MNSSRFQFRLRPVLFTALLGAAGLTACQRPETVAPAGGENAVAVRMAEVERRETSFPIHTAGMIALKETVKLSFKTGGLIAAIPVDEGQEVKEGQLLARLDLAEIEAREAKARSAFEKAERDLQRVRSLYQDQVAPLERLQDAETAYEMARSDLQVAEFNLKHSLINAPSNGKILSRFAEQGELIEPGRPVFVFASTDKNWILRFGAVDRDVVRLSLGDPADLYLDVFPERVFKGRVSEIAETANPQSGTFEVELELEAQAGAPLVSGFIAKVEVFPSQHRMLYFVPLQALVGGDRDRGFVFTVDPATSRAVKLPVQVYRILDGEVAIGSGLEQVRRVVSAGAPYLDQGTLVRIRNGSMRTEPQQSGP